jgi:hypothetical protein
MWVLTAPNLTNYVSLQHHVCGKWPHQRKIYGDNCHLQWADLILTLLNLPFGAHHESRCVSQVAVCTHTVSIFCALCHTPYSGISDWQLMCLAEHFRLCYLNALSVISWCAWTADFLLLLILLTNTLTRWSIFSVHLRKVSMNSH